MKDMLNPRDPRFLSPLERAQAVSRALSEAARRARFSSRARGAYQNTGFQSARHQRFMRLVRRVLFVLIVAIPNVVAFTYFGLLASDQFVSETRFTVSSGAIPKMDGLGTVTGVPSAMIMQDTMIISNYIESRRMVEELERKVGLRGLYGAGSIDWWARFSPSKPIEKFTDYWNKMVKTSISFPGGILTVEVRAFSPAAAKRILDAVVLQCETLVNTLNDRMHKDTVLASEQDLERAAERLKQARLQLERARNAEGVFDVRQASASLSQLLSELEADLLKKQSEYQTQMRYVTETTPQMRVLKTQIQSIAAQIEDLKGQITLRQEQDISNKARKTLSGDMTKFATLELEQQIAEKRYAAAVATLDAARMMAQRKMLYLHQVVAPTLPEEARYPKRLLNISIVLAGSLALWAIVVGLVSFVRNHMA
jgi:capsular polysaccharide transport system permease protein